MRNLVSKWDLELRGYLSLTRLRDALGMGTSPSARAGLIAVARELGITPDIRGQTHLYPPDAVERIRARLDELFPDGSYKAAPSRARKKRPKTRRRAAARASAAAARDAPVPDGES